MKTLRVELKPFIGGLVLLLIVFACWLVSNDAIATGSSSSKNPARVGVGEEFILPMIDQTRGIESERATQSNAPSLKIALNLVKEDPTKLRLEQARTMFLELTRFPASRGRAAFELGRLFRISEGISCAEIAFDWFVQSADWQYVKAHYEVARSYDKGIGVVQNNAKAMEQYEKALDAGSKSAAVQMLALAKRMFANSELTKSEVGGLVSAVLPKLEERASAGDARAARSLARLYQAGDYLPKNTKLALNWFETAANNGDEIAMHDLAMVVLQNEDPNYTENRVLGLLKESAAREYPAAFTALGRLHLGKFGGLSRKDGVPWLERGAIKGHAGSMHELAKLYLEGAVVERDIEMALSWASKGAELKHVGSRNTLTDIESFKRKNTSENATRSDNNGL